MCRKNSFSLLKQVMQVVHMVVTVLKGFKCIVYSWKSMLIKIPTLGEPDLLSVALFWRNIRITDFLCFTSYSLGAFSDS